MSRIGLAPITLPAGVDVSIKGSTVTVKGAKGSLSRMFSDKIAFSIDEGIVSVSRTDDARESRALHGLSRALLNNMVLGVSQGFQKDLQFVGVGYRASLQGSTLELLVGFSHPVKIEAPEGITFEVPEQTRVTVRGIDKELVGQIAADVRSVRPPEPYKGKGIRYVDEVVRRKAGKSGVAR
ncbi:MAG TPA: 50S ribosomal protein L6 [Acidimicrobiia bacterium]|uniref:Large ribosomal subunit protein uL6 n=1 Tax=uncultured actinobacterium Rifle_16ft_4_minimus_9892 TaxID=1665150 RepID=A0A0H4TAN8_9ACTN|nr:50S ribosomal protein L6, large subunit ribosomal protein L6 [uncultured actinobacterium Rifle_16ft_4_minimus_9892]HLA65901.1 50S ribosomal protein L6 [Acidimicrobiia bacterium]